MPEPTIPDPSSGSQSAEDAPPPTHPPAPDLPDELLPLHEEYGDYWRIGYAPLCETAPYLARPRFGGPVGHTVRTDTVHMLERVLSVATPDEDDDPAED